MQTNGETHKYQTFAILFKPDKDLKWAPLRLSCDGVGFNEIQDLPRREGERKDEEHIDDRNLEWFHGQDLSRRVILFVSQKDAS